MNTSAWTLRSGTATPVSLLLASSGVAPDRHLAQARSRYCTQGASGNGEPPGAADANASTPHAGAAPRRVLVVDDEALVRRMLSLFLTRAGFAPVAVESGSAALDLLRAGEAFELLITDQSMPGMTGCELIGEVVQLRPGLPVLLVTGYDMIGGLEQLPADVPVLRKPAERAAFLSQVRTLLSTTQAEESNQSET